MATLHNEFNEFNNKIKLSASKKSKLLGSRNALKTKIKNYFKNEKAGELQPKFWGQGSYEMNTIINPIIEYDENGEAIYNYDLDYGIYFIEKDGEDNNKSIDTWHNWVFNAVENHTTVPPIRKTTCVRVLFIDGHHIDLPIYYKKDEIISLAHRSKGWIESDPKEFYEWFNDFAKTNPQIRKIVRILKAWKNYKENCNSSLKLPSGFVLTILAVNNFTADDDDSVAFRKTVISIYDLLKVWFSCTRPTTPLGEELLADFSNTKKTNFLNSLYALVQACKQAELETNFKTASEHIRKQLGDRFPYGKDETVQDKSNRIRNSLASSAIKPKPYAE